MSSFPTGQCCAGDDCVAPSHELRHKCSGCNQYLHMLCGRVLEEAMLHFKVDDFVCRVCDPLTPRGIVLGYPKEKQMEASSNASTSRAESESVPRETSTASSFPTGRCCAGDSCIVPTQQLRHKCAGCKKFLHALWSRHP